MTVAILVLLTLDFCELFAKEEIQMSADPKATKATVAGGCFWCLEPVFDELDGVISTTPGYTGGTVEGPTYEEVSTGETGHVEAVEIAYDDSKIAYEELLEAFWRNINPTQTDGQFGDIGPQYRTAIFYHDPEQKRIAEASKEQLEKSGKFSKPIVTEIRPAGPFYSAEDYHRDYYKKNPVQYKLYKEGSGRAGFIRRTWGEKK
ncbi:MAG: peptide-methionine (S)-S-oxide reductase MsrA [Candidatus Omnitrophica bacterium]|nr:peptide-methionine (S)-S-oxide reductase MsrA [Candidatus Omnitrophota bacterium]